MKRLFFAGVGAMGFFLACSSTNTVTETPGPTTDAGPDTAVQLEGGGTMCTSARDQLLLPINQTSSGAVTVVSDDGTTKLLYVDASAGGVQNAMKQPRVYVDLDQAINVGITDVDAESSTAWDLALKRDLLFTNSGDAGPGVGGAYEFGAKFESVTDDQVTSAPIASERFFDADCNPQLDENMEAETTFSGWYDYDLTTHIPSPKPNVTYAVRGGTGKLFKVAIEAYDGFPDGGSRMDVSTGYYLLKVSEVTP